MRTTATLAVLALALIVGAALARKEMEFDRYGYTWSQYKADFKKSYPTPAEELEHSKIFSENLAKIIAHNRAGVKPYKLGVNKFTDMSLGERKSFLGYNARMAVLGETTPAPQLSLPEEGLPASVDYRNNNPPILTPVKDQGGCGSCWAHCATEEVETYLAIETGDLVNLSRQNINDCTPNPQHCGGTGGCEGATPELALTYVNAKGLASEAAYPYVGEDEQCNESIPKTATVAGYVDVESNNYTAVVTALAMVGPLGVSVDASSWFDYSSGVFTDCAFDEIDLDHAVQLVGYGTDSMDYWIVRNSWGDGWGESGFIRIQKHSDGSSQYCGPDNNPGDGSGCQGGPSVITVCGECGIWYDTLYAVGASKWPGTNNQQ